MAGPFQPKIWLDFPSLITPVSGAALTDLENRINTQVASLGTDGKVGGPGGSALVGTIESNVNKDAASGYAGLDSNAKLQLSEMPAVMALLGTDGTVGGTTGSPLSTPVLVQNRRYLGTILGGAGDNLDILSQEGPTQGQYIDLRSGTASAPDVSLYPVLKISRTVSYATPWNAAGQGGFWGGVADVNSAPVVVQLNLPANNQAQGVAIVGIAKTFGNTYGLSKTGAFSSGDAVGVEAQAWVQGLPRTDSNCGTTLNNPTITDPAIVAADVGKLVTGTGIPASTYVGTVTPGVSFLLSANSNNQVNINASATNNPISLSIGGSIAASIGLVVASHGVTSTTKRVDAGQIFTYNDTGIDAFVNPSGQTLARGFAFYSYGANLGGSALEFLGPDGQNGSQYDTCIHFSGQTAKQRTDTNCGTVNLSNIVTDTGALSTDFNRTLAGVGIPTNTIILAATPRVGYQISANATATTTPVTLTTSLQGPSYTSAIQDDSDSLYGLYITNNSNHQTAAIAVGASGGPTILGAVTDASGISPVPVLQVVGPSTGQRPILWLGNATNAQNYSMQMRNSAGVYEYFVAQTQLIAGTISGDGGIRIATAGKSFHIGGTQSVFKVGQGNTLGYFTVPPVAIQGSTANTSGFTVFNSATPMYVGTQSTGGKGTTSYSFGDIVALLKNYGLATP